MPGNDNSPHKRSQKKGFRKIIMLKRLILLLILGFEGVGGILGGILLVLAPDGHLMKLPILKLHGAFPNFLVPGLILTGMGILTITAFSAVLKKTRFDLQITFFALIGYVIWFAVEIAILRELHWLHIMWGVPVLVGLWAAFPLVSKNSY